MYFDRTALRQRRGHECKRDLKELVSLQRRFKQLEKFTFPFDILKKDLRVIEMHGFTQEEIATFKDKAVIYFKMGPDLYQFANLVMKFCSDMGKGDHWFVTVRPKNIDQGGWLHRDANYRLKMEFQRDDEEYSFNIFKLL